MRKSHITEGSCSRCGSLKHTLEEHNERMAEGRRKSVLWRQRMLEGNANKRGKPLRFSDPEARSRAIARAINSPEVKCRIDEARHRTWASRSEEQRRSLGEKISRAQKGRLLTPEHLANLRKANSGPLDDEHRKNLSAALKGREAWNKGLTKFDNASVMSVSLKQLGRVPDYNKYRAHYEGPKGRLLMRSRWEVAYAKYLDRQRIEWEYEPRWFNIGGGDWKGATYTPDFYLPATEEYIEVKGYLTAGCSRKLVRFAEKFPEIKLTVLKRPELIGIGIVDKHGRLIDCNGELIRNG